MAEIKINTYNLLTEIQNLNNLKAKMEASEVNCPKVIGGGTSIQEIEKFGKKLQDMKESMKGLIDNTVAFMENVNTSYQSNDKKAAKNFIQ